MQATSAIEDLRAQARVYEAGLPSKRRKAFGQFFTGMSLGRVLAHLAIDSETQTVLDPFAGTGDLLDAVAEAASSRKIHLKQLDAIELDAETAMVCEGRLSLIAGQKGFESRNITGDAFAPENSKQLEASAYDLVITNPPYVRYQTLNGRGQSVRANLSRQLATSSLCDEWSELAAGYSGLADLSVPAWLLSASFVRPGGRLALVVPSTWRSREYGDVIRYLLLRFFELETVVEDAQPGWFSDALVRTQLIVARRLDDKFAAIPIGKRESHSNANWIEVAPKAASPTSLLGSAFPTTNPEAEFAAWKPGANLPTGISARQLDLGLEWQSLQLESHSRLWFQSLEKSAAVKISKSANVSNVRIPQSIADAMNGGLGTGALHSLEAAGIHVGQGLRTGCNRFFYVRALGAPRNGQQAIQGNQVYGCQHLTVPVAALRPVLHRQSDLPAWREGQTPETRVLDLRPFVLPSDLRTAKRAVAAYDRAGVPLPTVMPGALASYVECVARTPLSNGNAAPALSAVRTNARDAREAVPPRFWYMLPDFQSRHLPQAFVPRIINVEPSVSSNSIDPILIDANFSSFWTNKEDWTATALTAFLNSVWCRANMEALGTPMGGGALKLEAVQLRKLSVPVLSSEMIGQLSSLWSQGPTIPGIEQIDEIVLFAAFPDSTPVQRSALKDSLYREMADSVARRRKVAA